MPLVKRSDDATRGDDHKEAVVDDAVGAQQERMNNIVEAIATLDDSQFTTAGVPEVDALKEVTGLSDITAKERDDAWKAFNS